MDVVTTTKKEKWIEKSRKVPYLVAYIKPSTSLARRAFSIERELRAVDSRHTFLPEACLHITLKEFGFLGDDVEPGNLPRVLDAVKRVASKQGPFSVSVGGVGIFPSTIYGRVENGAEEIRGMNGKLVDELDGMVIRTPYDRENFKPHISLLHFGVKDIAPLLKKAESLASKTVGDMIVRNVHVAKWYPYRLFGTKREREKVREPLAVCKLGHGKRQ